MKKLMICNDEAGTSKGNQQLAKRKRDTDDQLWAYYLKTRMSPKMLLTLINSELSEKQVADIKDMGFGGLLTLKADTVPGALAYWLVCTFNTASSSLMEGKLVITDEDIHLATGIPIGSKEVEIASRFDKNEDFIQIKNNWLTQFEGNPSKVDTKVILNLIISQREGGEEFKRNFIVFIVSSFLMGVKGTSASLRVLKCLRDVSSISSMNWCGFTRRQFIEGVESWRRSKNDFFKGPIMVFVFIYLDRVAFKYFSAPRIFPTLSNWLKDNISTRLNSEQAVGFGTGSVQPRITKGIDEENIVKDAPGEVPNAAAHSDARCPSDSPRPSDAPHPSDVPGPSKEKTDNDSHGPTSSVKKLANCANTLAIAYESFVAALDEAKVDWPECKVVKQMAQMAEAFNDCPYSSQDDIKGKGIQLDENEQEDKGESMTQTDTEGDDPCVQFSKLEFETEEELFEALVKLETVLGKRPTTRDRANKTMATESILVDSKPKEVKADIPVFHADIPIVHEQQHADIPIVHEQQPAKTSVRRSPRLTPPSFTPPSFQLLSSQEIDVVNVENLVHMQPDVVFVEDEVEVVEDDVRPLVVEPLSSFSPKENDKRRTSKRKRVETEVFRSPFLQRSIEVATHLNKSEKELLEFVFGESFDESELLFQSDEHKLNRGELKTLVSGDQVPKSVIDIWCLILNENEKSKGRGSPSRLYLSQSDSATNNSYIDDNADAVLVFVPVVCEKPFAFCFNFLTSKVEVIHGMKETSVPYDSMIQSAKEFLVRCMVKKKPTIEEEVLYMTTEEFVPKSNLGNGTDSGIYLMRFLEKYKGTRKSFSIALQDNNQVKLFGRKVCHQILTFKGNHLKNMSRSLTDTDLLARVINSRKDTDYLRDIVVDTEWIELSRGEFRSLQNRHNIIGSVIDAFGIMSTYNRQDVLYLPTTVNEANATKKLTQRDIVWCLYIKMHYKPKTAATINKVFFPIGRENHWFACVSDMKKQKNFVLNSMKPNARERDAYNTYISDIIFEFANRMNEIKGYEQLKNIMVFDTVYVDTPQQPNLNDCGVYVMKFLEAAINDTSLWTDEKHYHDLIAYRRQVMLQLLKWDKNRVVF